MKRSFLLAGLLFVLSFTISAQQNKAVFLHKQETMDAVGLNAEQQAKITALTKQSFADISQIKKNAEFSDSKKKSKISGIYKQRQKDYESTLTSEQLQKFNELKAAAKNQ